MAKQIGDTIFTGRMGNLVFYKMYEKGYVRMKSSITRKQFKTKACFAGSVKAQNGLLWATAWQEKFTEACR
jgi:hypothetical protein